MRLIALFFLATIAVVARAGAQESSHDLPGIVIGDDKNKGKDKNAVPAPGAPGRRNAGSSTANGAGASSSGTCTGKETDPAEAMKCLNRQLKGQADKVNPTPNTPPLDARSPDTKTGVVNIPAVQQQYGKNFGVSAVPFRPAAPTFTSPATHR